MTALLDRPPETLSLVERMVAAETWDRFRRRLTVAERAAFLYRWDAWRRPSQSVPGSVGRIHNLWMIRAGRGYGKTRTGAETTRHMCERVPRLALVGPTAADIRDTMVEGESGLLSVFPRHHRPDYEPSKRRVTFHTGATATLFSAEEPDRLRGPQHGWGWLDEPASYRRGADVMDNFLFGLRLGEHPWALLTGTPKPTPWLRTLSSARDCRVTTGSTYDNLAHLPQAFLNQVLGRYEGTRLGRQELHGEWLDDVEGALWTEALLELHRYRSFTVPFDWRTVVGVDPPGETAECGIVAAAAPARPESTSHCAILEDASLEGRPEAWGAKVVEVWRRWGADVVVVEANQGGDMVRAVIHAIDPAVPVAKARTREGKAARAEPVATLTERGRVHLVGNFPLLESQMVTWVPSEAKSPDRMDAFVWAVAALLPTDALVAGSVISVAEQGW